MKKISGRIQNAQSRAGRAAFDGILTNPEMPLLVRRRAAKTLSDMFRIARMFGYQPPEVALKVSRNWRPSPMNEASEKRLAANRRRHPKTVPFYKEDLYDKLFYYLDREAEFIDGRWAEHWGDAALYGIVSDALRWRMTGDLKSLERAMAARRANLADLRNARRDPRKLIEHAEGGLMAALGLIFTFDILPHWETVPEALDLIGKFNELMQAIGGYLDGDFPAAFADYYGRTTPTAIFFMINLIVADFLKRHDRPITADHWVADALKLLDAAKSKAYDFEGPRFLFNPGEQRAFCYPNPIFCLGLALLHRITGHRSALQEAEGVFNWMRKNMRDEKNGGYWTPYANFVRKKEYALNLKSLSAQNYVLFACLYLYEATGKDIYLLEIKSLLDFIERDLYFDGLLWHDVEDGKRADLASPEPYCVGCNLMTLYLLTKINYSFGLGAKLLEMDGKAPEINGRSRGRNGATMPPIPRPVKIEDEKEGEDLF